MNVQSDFDAAAPVRGRNVTAVLGPTNTGKTHLAIERMLAHPSGIIGLPLRLLAREVYSRIAERAGKDAVALITGEEKIVPPAPRYRVCTVEALPETTDASFLAIDEIQLAADLERGHVFTDRILNLRGRDETLLLGAATMRGVIEKLVPGVNVVTRPRLSVLSYSGSKKITRLPHRSVAVAFSADEVYAIGELIRRQRGGVAVVLGALSPRTRNAQVELFQNGDVDFLVATDAIGMGLNLDLDHVAFASDRKFDGFQYRKLSPAELAQIAGRAGRYSRDGTFGVTAGVESFDDELVSALESHRFQSVKVVQWRNRRLDFASLEDLRASLDRLPTQEGLAKAPPAEDVTVLEIAHRDPAIRSLADRPERIALLWDVCQIPDYRRIAPANHADLVLTLFTQLARDGRISDEWFANQVAYADRTDGDIDTLSNRIAHIRTWTYAANRPHWLADQLHWQERTRAIEDRLSDALHERLTQRFVDRRTSVLMRRLREKDMLEAEITAGGDVIVEGQHVGRLEGFRFAPDPEAGGPDAKAIRTAAQKALAGEITRRAEGVAAAANEQFVLASDGTLRWQGLAIARIIEGDDVLKPRLVVLADDALNGAAKESVDARLAQWLNDHIATLLQPLLALSGAEDLPGPARGLAFRLAEGLGVIERAQVAEEVRALDQDHRAGLRRLGVRFGAHNIYVPALLKPAPSGLLAMLWGLRHGGVETPGVSELPHLAAAGRTTIPVDPTYPAELYKVVGYRIAGPRAIRLDILERLADLIRPLLAWRPTAEAPQPPEGAVAGGGFTVTGAMTSLLGASGEDFAAILRGLNYRSTRRPKPAPVAPTSETEPSAEPAVESEGGEELSPAVMPESSAETPATSEGDMVAAPGAAEVDAAVEAAGEPESTAAETSMPPPEIAAMAAVDLIDDSGPAPAEEALVAGDEPASEVPAVPDMAAAVAAEAPVAAIETEAAVPDEATPAEPDFIEVWRPGRAGGDNRRPRPERPGRRPPPARVDTPPAAGAEEGAGGRAGEQRRFRDDGDRPERRESRRPDQERQRRGRDRDSGRDDARPSRDDRKPRRDRDRQQNDPRPPPSPRPDRAPDPDSPFAKLAALKAALEARNRE